MIIPTEPIGSIPRAVALLGAVKDAGSLENPLLDRLYEAAVQDTIRKFEAAGSPVITEGEQRRACLEPKWRRRF
jgi:5-methyltetrahydropteroyltriglutamate--homocysteine methyltransferase